MEESCLTHGVSIYVRTTLTRPHPLCLASNEVWTLNTCMFCLAMRPFLWLYLLKTSRIFLLMWRVRSSHTLGLKFPVILMWTSGPTIPSCMFVKLLWKIFLSFQYLSLIGPFILIYTEHITCLQFILGFKYNLPFYYVDLIILQTELLCCSRLAFIQP